MGNTLDNNIVSKQAVLDAIEDDARCGVYSHFASYDDAQAFKNYIKDLPPVKPAEKVGHWRHYEGMLICSECGAEFYDDIMEYCGDDVPKYCPDCGAKMGGTQNDD